MSVDISMRPDRVSSPPRAGRGQIVFAVFLIVSGVIGWYAAFALTLDKIAVLKHPAASLDCNISPLVQCGKNLASWQGSVLGFPNPLIGLACWAAPIVVGVSLLAGARFARWYWTLFNIGVAGAMAFVFWLSTQSIWVLGTLCPWCMLTWSIVIPLFWTVTIRNMAAGVFGVAAARPGRSLMFWALPLILASYLVIAAEAQLRFDIITTVFHG